MPSPCNVWGVGAILASLMRKTFFNADTQPDYLDTGLGSIDPELVSYKFTEAQRKRYVYQPEMYEIVERCLKVDPKRRPTFGELLDFVEGHEKANLYFRNASGGNQRFDCGLLISPETEKYKLGFSFWEVDQEGYAAFPDEPAANAADAMMGDMEELDFFL